MVTSGHPTGLTTVTNPTYPTVTVVAPASPTVSMGHHSETSVGAYLTDQTVTDGYSTDPEAISSCSSGPKFTSLHSHESFAVVRDPTSPIIRSTLKGIICSLSSKFFLFRVDSFSEATCH